MKKILFAALVAALPAAALAQVEQPLTPAAPIPPRVAPATPAPAAASDWTSYKDPYSGEQNDIKTANRTQDEITVWAQSRATDLMSFTPAELSKKISDMKTVFTLPGWNEYATYLQTSRMIEMVRDRKYSVTTIVNGDSLILDSRNVAGSYHWIVQMPLMVTFLHPDDAGDMAAVAGGEFRLTLSVGRVKTGGIDGMAVESWKVEPIQQREAPPVAPQVQTYNPVNGQ